MMSDQAFEELRAEFNQALVDTDCFAEGKPDRTNFMIPYHRAESTLADLSVAEIRDVVARETGASAREIAGHGRRRRIVRARWLTLYVLCELHPELNDRQISEQMGYERTAISHAYRSATKLLEDDMDYHATYQSVRWRLGLA